MREMCVRVWVQQDEIRCVDKIEECVTRGIADAAVPRDVFGVKIT